MNRREAVMNSIHSNGGWPFGVRRVEVNWNCHVFFDGVYVHELIDKKEISELIMNNVLVYESDYNKWKSSHHQSKE